MDRDQRLKRTFEEREVLVQIHQELRKLDHIKPSTEVALFSQLPEAPQSNQSLPAFDHPLTIKELIDQGALDQAHHSGSEALLTAQISGTLEPIYSRTAPVWPLTDVSEALLLRHFVQNLAIWVKPYHPPTKELKIF
jgi:hypothetical protein